MGCGAYMRCCGTRDRRSDGIVSDVWDGGNSTKNDKHGVSQGEAEQVFFNTPLLLSSDTKHNQTCPGKDRHGSPASHHFYAQKGADPDPRHFCKGYAQKGTYRL